MSKFMQRFILIISIILIKFSYKKRNLLIFIRSILPSNWSSSRFDSSLKCTINQGTWTLGHLPISLDDHPYFPAGVAQKLKTSLVNSNGTDLTLLMHYFNYALVRLHWSGREVISNNSYLDSEFSIGLPNSQADSDLANSHIYLLKNSLLITQRNSSNYYHFVIEVLPSLLAWKNQIDPHEVLVFFDTSFTIDAVRMCGFTNPIRLIPANSILLIKNVKILQLIPTGYLNLHLLNDLRSHARNKILTSKFPPHIKSKYIFLNRLDSEGRKLKNESQALDIIKKFYPDIQIIFPGDLSFIEQIHAISDARLIISIHGAQSTNILWATKLEFFIEISSFSSNLDFVNLSSLLGSKYFRIESLPTDPNNLWSSHECNLSELEINLSIINNSFI